MSARTPDDDAAPIARAVGGLERPAAVVFDSDGVLLDSGPAWKAARTELFERHGRTFGEDENREAVGTGVAGTGRLLSRLLDRPDRSDDLSDEFEVLLSGEMGEGRPPPARGARARGGVARLGPDRRGLELPPGDPRGGPRSRGPQRIHPAEGVAVEDSPAGVAAARAAGLYVIGIPSLAGVALEADMTADSLDQVAVRERLGVAGPTPLERRG